MASLETKYLGLSLKSPVIVGSSPLTQNVVSLEKCEEAGAGAVVLKSIFEEQIESEVSAEVEANDEYLNFSSFEIFPNISPASSEKNIGSYPNPCSLFLYSFTMRPSLLLSICLNISLFLSMNVIAQV